MADNASLARPYAKAVFDLAQEANNFAEWEVALDQLSAVSIDSGFVAIVNDPRVTTQSVIELLSDATHDVLPEGGNNLISLLAQNDRLSALSQIKQQFVELVAKAQASVNAEVMTAMPLSDEQRKSLTEALEARLGLKVTIDETVDADLIGGAVIKAGDLVIDGSAKGRIEKLTTTLMR